MIFLDISGQFYSIFRMLVISVAIGIICWLFMLLLVLLLSRKAILPIAKNIEKQKQFVTNAGHEIKTPLAIILANTEAMELHNGESKWSRNIRTQTLRLNGLMQNLLTLARMEENPVVRCVSEFSVGELLEETLQSFCETAALRQIILKKQIEPKLMLGANREQIRQMYSILLDNAVKYANEGGEIVVSLWKKEHFMIFQVENTCTQLPEVEPEKLFDRFYRGNEARTQKSGGYGIGLSAAQAIAEAYKGSIKASYNGTDRIIFTVKISFSVF